MTPETPEQKLLRLRAEHDSRPWKMGGIRMSGDDLR